MNICKYRSLSDDCTSKDLDDESIPGESIITILDIEEEVIENDEHTRPS